jgi:predicted MFS family arabinose efflux permease
MPSVDLSAKPTAPFRLTRAEWGILFVFVAIQFTHIVDFVIIMPLGDRLRREMEITTNQFGTVIAMYAWAAGIASLISSFVMDRFDRKSTLLVMYAGFAVSTLVCGLSPNFEWLLVSRTLAGAFGGVAAVALMSSIGDVFPPEKRGRAAGAVISAFAVASIIGLPIGLKLASAFGRAAPFIALAGLSAIVWLIAMIRLPAIRGHLDAKRRHPIEEFIAVIREPNHLRGFAFTFFLILGTFTVASFIAVVYCSQNGWGEDQLFYLYMASGVLTLFGTNLVGRFADRLPRLPLFRALGFGALVLAIVIGFSTTVPLWAATLAIALFMTCAAGRMVPAQAMLLGAAAPAVRGAFMSLNTAVQHFATGVAPTIAGAILVEDADRKLNGFWMVGLVSAAAAGVSLILAGFLKPVPQHVAFPAPATSPSPGESVETVAAA